MAAILVTPQVSASRTPPGVPAVEAPPGSDPLRPVLETYARALGVAVTLHIPPRHYRPPQPRTALHVHCFAVPTRPLVLGVWPRIPMARLPFAFGYPLAGPGTCGFAAGPQFGRGRILTDAEGHSVVEVSGANLYILWDLLAQGELAPILLRRCLDLALGAAPSLARLSPLPPKARADAVAALATGTAEAEADWRACTRDESRRRFQAACGVRLAGEVRRLEREIGALETTLEEYGRRITAETRALTERRRRLRTLQDLRAEPPDSLAEFDRIRDLPEVRHADLQDGAVILLTHPLEADCAGRRYRLGAFRVAIQFDGDVRIANLTDPRGPYDHPHVRQERPCLGNVREGLAKLIGEFELAAAAQVVLDFLQTVNPQDWRIPVFYWPRVDP